MSALWAGALGYPLPSYLAARLDPTDGVQRREQSEHDVFNDALLQKAPPQL